MRLRVVRVLVVLTLVTGTLYVGWRWLFSVNWGSWWIAVPLVLAETWALLEAAFVGVTVWRLRQRHEPRRPLPGMPVDVFVTTYDEPVEAVLETAGAAKAITYPHKTWILDDGDRTELRKAAKQLGIGYITRSDDWVDRPRHARAGNLNDALFRTDGDFMLILEADQVPAPQILDRTLAWFADSQVAIVQTPQHFGAGADADPLGPQSPLFFGPVQRGRDGWNAAFFCGSTPVIRREALMQLGIVGYVREAESTLSVALRTAGKVLTKASRLAATQSPTVKQAISSAQEAVKDARSQLSSGASVSEVTVAFQQEVDAAASSLTEHDGAATTADRAAIEAVDRVFEEESPLQVDTELGVLVLDEEALDAVAQRDWSPLGALESIRSLLRAVRVHRAEHEQPVAPVAGISVTDDAATGRLLHAHGWRTVYQHEQLTRAVAPEDLGTMLRNRMRWAQGSLTGLLKEGPLRRRGLRGGQWLMYLATLWSYLAGFAAVAFMAVPVLYLTFGASPVTSYDAVYVAFLVPYVLATQLLFAAVGYGRTSWRGHRYVVALFPVWMRAVVSAAAEVWFHRPLRSTAVPRTRPGEAFRWRVVWPQLTAAAVLVLAILVGAFRLGSGASTSTIGTLVNVAMAGYALLLLTPVVRPALSGARRTSVAA